MGEVKEVLEGVLELFGQVFAEPVVEVVEEDCRSLVRHLQFVLIEAEVEHRVGVQHEVGEVHGPYKDPEQEGHQSPHDGVEEGFEELVEGEEGAHHHRHHRKVGRVRIRRFLGNVPVSATNILMSVHAPLRLRLAWERHSVTRRRRYGSTSEED